MTIPTVLMQNTTISCTVIFSPMSKYAIIDVRNGFSKMRITLEVEVKRKAQKMSKWAKVVPMTLAIT